MKHQTKTVLLATFALAMSAACSTQGPAQPSALSETTLQTSGGGSSPLVPRAEPRNSEQVVFSGVAASNSTFANGSPVGFWIWCEAESTNSYVGECNGSMYFYALGITKHVDDVSIVEPSEGLYQITVKSTKDDSIACTLSNTPPPVNGPNNTVSVVCQTPSGSAVSNNAVVKVTGPPGIAASDTRGGHTLVSASTRLTVLLRVEALPLSVIRPHHLLSIRQGQQLR
jgi:hypothetical protein